VEQGELPRVVERWGEPTGGAIFNSERPVDEGAGSVVLGGSGGGGGGEAPGPLAHARSYVLKIQDS
jgi:hypothetical protein